MAYEYTVFLSYHRDLRVDAVGRQSMSVVGEWVHEVFHPHLKKWLVEFDPDAKVAFDGDLAQGARSEHHVRGLLTRSRCMLVVFSAPYFASRWCRAEWHSMLAREQLRDGGVELVIPVVFADGDHFDDQAKDRVQGRDAHRMQPFTVLGPRNQDHASFPDFRAEIRRLCAQICECARNAPEWREDFPWESPEPLAARRPFSPPSLQG
ncbi:MAG: TIR domain-containing protein [Planctomycetota bacterium]